MEERKSNKKTRGIIIAAMVLLLVAILCLCGTTFAKYITSTTVPTQQATVAKWGFVVNANADSLFGTGYKNTEVKTAGDTGVDVKSTVKVGEEATDPLRNVVAPGTTGSMTFSVSGQAEVLAQITLAMKEVQEIALKQGATVVYNPIKWTLKSGTVDGTYDETVVANETLANIATEVAKADEEIQPGSAAVTKFYQLSWEWAFQAAVTDITDETAQKAAIAQQDRYDTLLGYAAQGAGTYGDVVVAVADGVITVTDNAPETPVSYTAEIVLAFDLSISVEQIQNKA